MLNNDSIVFDSGIDLKTLVYILCIFVYFTALERHHESYWFSLTGTELFVLCIISYLLGILG